MEHHSDKAVLISLCDVNIERCKDINEVYGTNATTYTNYDQMLVEETLDMVIVVTPEKYHAEHDPLNIFASAKEGALSTSIGAAANISAVSGEPVDLKE